MATPANPTDADALRVLGDQLEEHGLDAGAALLRDVAGRLGRLEAINAEIVDSLRGFVYFPTVAMNGLDLDELRRSIEEDATRLIARSEAERRADGAGKPLVHIHDRAKRDILDALDWRTRSRTEGEAKP